MGRFSIVEAGTEGFAGALAAETFQDRNAHPVYGDFARVYFPIVFGVSLDERSFVVADAGAPALLVQCSVHQGVLSHYGFPVRFQFRPGLTAAEARKCAGFALAHIDESAPAAGIREARISGGPADGLLSPVDRVCLDRFGRPEVRMRAEADLSRPEAALRRDVRESYRSLINWGRRNLRLVYINAENRDRDLMDAYAEFHARTAGRVIHREATWAALFRRIGEGAGELTMGYLDSGKLVSSSMVVDGDHTALYFSAVYDRRRFDKPMGHWPLFNAMLRAKARGRRYFDLGEFFARGTVGAKEFNIGFFKRGFTSRHVAEIVWRVPLARES